MTSARLATDAPSEKAKLVASLQALTGELTLQIQQGRQSFERLPLDDFLSSSHQDGLISVYPVQSYIRCWRSAGVKTRAQLEQLWASYYSNEDVRECVEDLLEAENAYGQFMADIDEATQAYEDKLALDIAGEGSSLPPDLSLTDTMTGEPLRLEKVWKKARFTLFVLRKHFA